MNNVRFILDEAAMLGSMDSINEAVGIGRGYGINLDFYYQSMGQLKRCFPDGQEHTLLSNTTQIFFGVNDNMTADYVSTRLGDETIVVQSGGTSSGRSTQWSNGMHPSQGGGTSSNESQNWQQMARRLLKPEEVMALPARTAITFTPNISPICTELIRYFEERQLGIKSDRIRLGYERRDLILSAIWCGLTFALTVGVFRLFDHVNPGFLFQ